MEVTAEAKRAAALSNYNRSVAQEKKELAEAAAAASDGEVGIGFGRIVVSESERPNLLVNPVQRG